MARKPERNCAHCRQNCSTMCSTAGSSRASARSFRSSAGARPSPCSPTARRWAKSWSAWQIEPPQVEDRLRRFVRLRTRSYRRPEPKGNLTMTTFNDRERAEEAKFAHDAEMTFRIHARRNRLLGPVGGRAHEPAPDETRGLCQGGGAGRFRGSGRRGRDPQAAGRSDLRRRRGRAKPKSAPRWRTSRSRRAAR